MIFSVFYDFTIYYDFTILRFFAKKNFSGPAIRVPVGCRRSQELRGSPELQNGGLRAPEEAWDGFLLFCLRHFSVKCGRFLCVWGLSWWLQEVSSSVPGGARTSGEAQSFRTVA